MEIKPLKDFVFLEEIERPKLQGSIVLPDGVDLEPTKQAMVVEVGPMVDNGLGLKRGDKVLFRPHLFEEVVVEKRKLLVGRVENIFAVLDYD